MSQRIPLPQEPIAGMDAVIQYDKGAKYYMMPEYKYMVWKILHMGITEGRVLDIGTGSGLLAIELARIKKRNNFDITGLDISESMLKKARENARRCHVEDKVKFLYGTASSLPFPDKTFDLVISYASIHHWFNPVAVFDEVARVTKETGCFIIRDNIRVYQNPFWKFGIWLVSRFMNKRHRENWPEVIRASYTIQEIKELVSKSQLKNYKISRDFLFIDLCIESQCPAEKAPSQ